jgi:phosphopantothenoylcysteine decarboxylase/phosphopantothenate--cysteine ligase
MGTMAKPKRAFLITAGPTVEDIDPVRFLSNRATGKLGFAAARAALAAGHRVTLVHGPVADGLIRGLAGARGPRRRLSRVAVRSCAQMHRAVTAAVADVDVVLMTAAVADFAPSGYSATKLKKSGAARVLRLKPTTDILAALGRHKEKHRPGLVLIGFALETGSGPRRSRLRSRLAEARRKLEAKNLDAIVLDSPSEMGADEGVFRILRRGVRRAQVLRVSKRRMGGHLVELAETLLGG